MSTNNNSSNANYNGYSAYPYGQYSNYYYQQYYTYPQQQPQQPIPQGDPSAALSSITYQYQHQQQQYNQQQQQQQHYQQQQYSQPHNHYQQQAYQPYSYPPGYYNNYYTAQAQRSVVNYHDLSHEQPRVDANAPPPPPPPAEKPKEPEIIKPKFCCYRTLKSTMAISQHEKLHVKCPSCDFMCLPSILQEHEEIYHGKEPKEPKKQSRPDGIIPPNAPKIEDLDAWITERKKNWPSKTNVERKEKEYADKVARGEIVPKQKRKSNNQDGPTEKKQKMDSVTEGDNSDSDETMDPEKHAITSKDPSAMGKILLPEDRPKRLCKYFASGKCRKGSACSFSHERPDKSQRQPRVVNPIRKRPNLLFKLLEKEITQEKSVILQCLRYIVDNDFFDNPP